MHVTGTKYKFSPLNKGMVKKSILVFFSVSYVCTSLAWWVQQCPKSLRAPWTAWALPEGQAADSLSSHVQLHTKLFTVLGLEVQDAVQKLYPARFYKIPRNPPPLPAFPSHPSQQPASHSCGLPLIPLGLLSSLSASDRMCTAISCWATGGALATSSNSLWDWQPSAPKGIRNTTGKQFES